MIARCFFPITILRLSGERLYSYTNNSPVVILARGVRSAAAGRGIPIPSGTCPALRIPLLHSRSGAFFFALSPKVRAPRWADMEALLKSFHSIFVRSHLAVGRHF